MIRAFAGKGTVPPRRRLGRSWDYLRLETREANRWRAVSPYLMKTQNRNGSWNETLYTGTGFPRVFYLMYHLYRQYFPLLALTAYAKVMEKAEN